MRGSSTLCDLGPWISADLDRIFKLRMLYGRRALLSVQVDVLSLVRKTTTDSGLGSRFHISNRALILAERPVGSFARREICLHS